MDGQIAALLNASPIAGGRHKISGFICSKLIYKKQQQVS